MPRNGHRPGEKLMVIVSCLAVASCAKIEHQRTMQNVHGDVVVCKPPPNAPELTAHGRLVSVVEWCALACGEHGYRWVGKYFESGILYNDFELGKREREVANNYVPTKCLPFNPPSMGIVRLKDGSVPDCIGGFLKSGCK